MRWKLGVESFGFQRLPQYFRRLLLHATNVVVRAGSAAVFAAEEFFFGTIRNEHTRRAYLHAVRQFLAWCETRSLELPRIAPRDVGQYLTSLAKTTCGFRSDGDHESEVMSISNPN